MREQASPAIGTPHRPGVSRLLWIVWVSGVLLALGPQWLSPREIYDSVVLGHALESRDLRGLDIVWLDSNWLLFYWPVRLFDWLGMHTPIPYWAWARAVITISVIGLAIESGRLGRDVFGLTQRDAHWVTAFVLVFPAWCLLYGTAWMMVAFMWFGFWGHRLLHSSHGLQQFAGYLLVLASLQVNSNLVLIPALEATRWLLRPSGKPWSYWRSLILLAMVVCVFFAIRTWFAPRGVYEGYNYLIMPTSVAAWVQLLKPTLMFASWAALFGAPVAVALAVRWLTRHRLRQASSRDESNDALGFARQQRSHWVALALLIIGSTAPYILVGKAGPLFFLPTLSVPGSVSAAFFSAQEHAWFIHVFDGWTTRHTFLLAVPATIAAAYGVQRLVSTARWREAIWLVCCIYSSAWLVAGQQAKLSRLADEQAIIEGLKAVAAPAAGEVDFVIRPTKRWMVPPEGSNYILWNAYRRSEWASVMYYDEPVWRTTVRQFRADHLRGSKYERWRDRIRNSHVMNDFRSTDCASDYAIDLPEQPLKVIITAGHMPSTVTPARITRLHTSCP